MTGESETELINKKDYNKKCSSIRTCLTKRKCEMMMVVCAGHVLKSHRNLLHKPLNLVSACVTELFHRCWAWSYSHFQKQTCTFTIIVLENTPNKSCTYHTKCAPFVSLEMSSFYWLVPKTTFCTKNIL